MTTMMMAKIDTIGSGFAVKMRHFPSLYRIFLEKKMESSWNSGFFWGAITGSLAITYLRNRDKLKHAIPPHTGDDCVYCKEYYSSKKTYPLQ